MKSWPKTGEPVDFSSLSAPLIKAARRFLKTGNGRYSGLDHPHSAHVCPPPNEILSPSGLESGHKQGRDALDLIIGVALQLGIEQGIRMERTRAENRTIT